MDPIKHLRTTRALNRNRAVCSVALFIALSSTVSFATSPQQTKLTPLETGKPVESQIAGGESHSYSVSLAAGNYALVVVDQRGINLVVSIFDHDGKNLLDMDLNPGGNSEEASLLAERATSYRVEVRSPDKNVHPGSYGIKIREMRTATEQDRSRLEAEKLMAAGIQLMHQQTKVSQQGAVNKFQQSLTFWRTAKQPAHEARALYLLAYNYILLGENQKALDACDQGLPLARAAGDRQTEAYLLDTIGSVYSSKGDNKKSLEFFNRALPLREANDRAGRANTLNNIGITYAYMGDRPKALEYLTEVALILRELGERKKEASALGNICVIQKDLGEYKKALDFCRQSLAIKRDLQDRSGEATGLNNLGTIYSSSGDYQAALDSYNQSREIHRQLSDRRGEAIVLNNIGWIYNTLGEYQRAVDFYGQALQPFRDAGDKYATATTLGNLGVNYAELKDYRKALDLHLEALPLRRATGDREGEAVTLNNIASSYSNLGDKPKALEYYTQAVALLRTVGNPRQLATALKNIGVFHLEAGQHSKALDYLNEALKLTRSIGDLNGEAATLFQIAKLERDRHNLAAARTMIEEAIVDVESLRINLKSQQLRTTFLASRRRYYEFAIDVLMRLHKQDPSAGYDSAALQATERGRARSLLELLREARAEIRQGADPSLIDREDQLRRSIVDGAERQTRLLSSKHTAEQAAAAAKEVEARTIEYEQVQAQIRQTSPRYAALTQPQPLSLQEIQQQVVDDDSLLLEYALGEERSFLWAVTPTSLKSFELPKRAVIEETARRFYQILTERGQNLPNETAAQRKQRLDQADAAYPRASAALSQILLGPAAAELKTKRLVIVGEGILQYVPFAALPKPGGDAASSISQPLIIDHEVVTLPSASVLNVLRQETASRKPAGKTIAVLADPVFSISDPRIAASEDSRQPLAEAASPLVEVKRSASESGLGNLVRLRFSRQEAEEITRLAADKMKLKALDFAANRSVATNRELGDYRIVHFATHGLINSQHPDLSGVVLSLVDQQGRPQNGFLRLYDIYNLKLGADLVVLSACQTALGKEIQGEGLIGLTRGFMYAGSPRVVASLWQVDDRATAELMRRFYDGMLRESLRPAAALKSAQVSMTKDKRWQLPHYWAAFTLQGEWR